jgi:branched-chain amino acid transport system permease protein
MGAFMERTVVRPFERGPPLTTLIVTVALFSLFSGVTFLVWGKTTGGALFPTLVAGDPTVELAGVRMRAHSVAIMGVTAAIMAVLYLFFQYTKTGLALRAVSENAVGSQLMGVRVRHMLVLSWALSATVGAVGGMLIAPLITTNAALMPSVLVFALVAMVLGGMDSPPGVVLAGLVIGVTQNLYMYYSPGDYLGPGTELTFALVLILLVLLVRPQGILGTRKVTRV